MTPSRILVREKPNLSNFNVQFSRYSRNIPMDARLTNLPISKENTIIVFDWDDTLFPTSFMTEKNLSVHSHALEYKDWWSEFERISNTIISILRIARELGEVVIITNAEKGWVEMSSQKFLPRTVPYLNNLKIYSAATNWKSTYPDSPDAWKKREFASVFASKMFNSDYAKNFISIGDSVSERRALASCAGAFNNAFSKSLKFVPHIISTEEEIQQKVGGANTAIHISELYTQHCVLIKYIKHLATVPNNVDEMFIETQD